jgi:sugar phosphate isomerase/epimerase
MKNTLAISVVDQIIGNAPYMCQGNFLDCIRQMKAMGYEGVELNVADPAELDIPALKKVCASCQMRIVAFGTGRVYVNDGISLTDPDPEIRGLACKRLVQFMDIAAQFNSIVIIGCIRGNIKHPDELPGALMLLGEAMVRLDAYAAEKNVTMVFEPINRYENNFLGNAAEVSEFIHRFGLTHTKILMDTFHMNIEEADMIRSIHEFGADTAYVHLADSNRKYPGCGHIDFDSILRAFRETGYAGPFVAECHALNPQQRPRGCRAWLENVRVMMQNAEK